MADVRSVARVSIDRLRSIWAILFWRPVYGKLDGMTAIGYRKDDTVYIVGRYKDDADAKRYGPEFDMCAQGIGEHYFEEYE